MLPNALTATIALALAVPGSVIAVDAANDDSIPGLSTATFMREHFPGGGGHARHDHAHAHAHDGAHDRAHEKAAERHARFHENGTHDHPGHHGKHGHPYVQTVARCLASDNTTDQDCITLAQDIANRTVDQVATCMASDEPRPCHTEEGTYGPRFAARIADCIEEQGQEPCADLLATHLLCHGARMAGVESPVDCPTPEHRKPHEKQPSDDPEDTPA